MSLSSVSAAATEVMDDRFGNLVTELTAEFETKKLLLEEQEKRLTEERQRLTKEKEVMTKIQCSDNDIVHLNVGGTIFATKRGSLRLVPGSVLELMFSGRWEDRVDRDKDGYVFLDLDPALFGIILRYLVALHNYGMAAEHLELRPIPTHLEEEFRLMLQYLGLEQIIQPRIDFKWSSVFKTPTVSLRENETIAVSDGAASLRHHVLSQASFARGVYKFRIFVEFLEEWAMLGVVKEDAHLSNQEDICNDPSAYGWGSSGEVFIKGVESSKEGYPGRRFQTGDTLTLTMDGRCSILSLAAPIGDDLVEYRIPHLSGDKFRLVLSTYFGSSAVEVIAH